MNKKKTFGVLLAAGALAIAVIQFIPSPPLVVPAQLAAEERSAHRLLNFEGISNFRDLGGYPAADGRAVKWGKLYRSGHLATASKADLAGLAALQLASVIDFRSGAEKAEEPNRLPDPANFALVEIPVLDEGNRNLFNEISTRIEQGTLGDFDPDLTMIQANRQFADEFTPQFRQFVDALLAADGAPVLWHCTAGKDRTGFAAAVLLRILGVPQDMIMQDYLASAAPALASRNKELLMLRLFEGEETADKIAVMLGVEPAWLEAAFEQIDTTWGSFDNYVAEGLQLSSTDVQRLQATLLE